MVFTNVYNPRLAVVRKDEYRRTLFKQGATIGAGAVIDKDVKPYALMAGVPARQIGWMSQHGERLDLPLTGTAEATCPDTGRTYHLENGAISTRS